MAPGGNGCTRATAWTKACGGSGQNPNGGGNTGSGGSNSGYSSNEQQALDEAEQAASDAEAAKTEALRLENELTTYLNDWSNANNKWYGIFPSLFVCAPICFEASPEYNVLNRQMAATSNQLTENTEHADSAISAMSTFLGMPRPALPNQYDVHDPVSGNRITDIDTVFRGYLTEEKSATWAMDNEGFAAKLVAQLGRYVTARQYVPGWEDAPVAERFTEPGMDPALQSAVQDATSEWADETGIEVALFFEGE